MSSVLEDVHSAFTQTFCILRSLSKYRCVKVNMLLRLSHPLPQIIKSISLIINELVNLQLTRAVAHVINLLTHAQQHANTHTYSTESVHFPTVIDGWGAEQSERWPCCPCLALRSWWWWWWLMVRNHLIRKINCMDSNRSVTCSFNPWLLTLVETTDIITVQSGDAIVLHSNLTEADLQSIKDVRWTHRYLVVSLKSNVTVCPHGRCELLTDGSLRFNCVNAEDAGSYRLQAFKRDGSRVMTKDFLLQVDTGGTAPRLTSLTQQLLPTYHHQTTSQHQIIKSTLLSWKQQHRISYKLSFWLPVCLCLPPPSFLSVASSSVLVHTLTWVFPTLLLILSLIIFVIIRRRHRSMSPGMRANQKQPDLCRKNQSTVY